MDIEQLERLSPGDWFFDVRDQLKWHIYRRAEAAFAAADAKRDRLTTPESVRAHQTALRKFFLDSIGGLLEDSGSLDARVTGEVRCEGFRIEKLVYESWPGCFVTSLLYLPDSTTQTAPAVLFLCGHAAEGKAYPQYQRVCQLLALHGFVVLAQDPIGQGERLSYWDPGNRRAAVGPCTLEHDHAGAQCLPLGWSLARFFLHDARRSLDYLCARPEVDPRRVGLTGNSGGGTQSCLLMMTDPRIAAAAPGTFIMNRQTYMYSGGAQDAEQIWPGFTAAGYDHEDVLIAMAPKPVCVLAVTDDFFPIEGTRRTVARCRRIWEVFGVEDLPALVEDCSDHAYTPRLAVAATRFFATHLLGAEVSPDYGRTRPLPESDLRCTRSGQVREEFVDSKMVFEACQTRRDDLDRRRANMAPSELRARAIEFLRERVFHARTVCDLNPRTYWSGYHADLSVSARVWWSQPDLMGHGMVFRSSGAAGGGDPVTIAVWEGGTTSLQPHLAWIRREVAAGRTVIVLDVSGVGGISPHSLLSNCPPLEFYGVIHKLTDDLIWLGDSLAALRTYDVLRCIEMAFSYDRASEVRIFVDGSAGREAVYGIFASILDERVGGLECAGPLPKYSDWVGDRFYDSRNVKAVLLPAILEYCDVDDLMMSSSDSA